MFSLLYTTPKPHVFETAPHTFPHSQSATQVEPVTIRLPTSYKYSFTIENRECPIVASPSPPTKTPSKTMAPVLDKLRKIKNKSREPKEPKQPRQSKQLNDPKQDTQDDKDRPPKSQLARIIGSAANRTFLTASPRAASNTNTAEDSPVTIQSLPGPPVESLSLDDADDGTEAYFRNIDIDGLRVAACTTAGWQLTVDTSGSGQPLRVRKKNQDAYAVEPFFGGLLAVVYDGHGAHGRAASQLVRDTVPTVLNESLRPCMEREVDGLCGEERRRLYVRAMNKAFVEGERALKECETIDDAYSGTTATAVWIDGGDVYVAWTGDSRAVMGHSDGSVDVSWDQKPIRVDEKKRVRHAGGRVTRWKKNMGPQRVWLPEEWLPGLAMTRSIGDTVLSKYGVIPNPEVTVTRFDECEQFLVVASDGLWEFMTSLEVVNFVNCARVKGSTEHDIARALVREAVRRWNENESVVDDTTVVVIFAEGGKMETRKEGETRRSMLRRRRQEVSKEARVGVPWLVSHNGRLEPFLVQSTTEDSDDE